MVWTEGNDSRSLHLGGWAGAAPDRKRDRCPPGDGQPVPEGRGDRFDVAFGVEALGAEHRGELVLDLRLVGREGRPVEAVTSQAVQVAGVLVARPSRGGGMSQPEDDRLFAVAAIPVVAYLVVDATLSPVSPRESTDGTIGRCADPLMLLVPGGLWSTPSHRATSSRT